MSSVYGDIGLYDLSSPLSDSQRQREDELHADRARRARTVCAGQLHGDDLSTALQALGLAPYDSPPATRAAKPHDAAAWNAKVDHADIAAMRDRRAGGESYASIARAFGIGESTAHRHCHTVDVIKPVGAPA